MKVRAYTVVRVIIVSFAFIRIVGNCATLEIGKKV